MSQLSEGYWELGRTKPQWVGGDYNGSWSSVTQWLRFPTKEAAMNHKQVKGWDYSMFKPSFEKWDK